MASLSSRYTYEGTEVTETAITRVGGTVDPTGAAQSRKITTTANSQWLRPFQAEPYAVWNPTAGANVDVTVYGTVNAGALPNNDDIWMDVEYLGTLAAIPPVGPAAWDPTTSANITLSGGNLVATSTGTTSDQGARVTSVFSKTTGKYYFEATLTTVTSGPTGNTSIGVGTTASTYTNIGGSGTTGVVLYTISAGGQVYASGSSLGSILGSRAAGDIIGVAVDLDNRRIWFRVAPTGNWNGNATYSPTTNVGGFTIPAGTITPFVTFGGSGSAAGTIITTNFGASAFNGSVPSGFVSGWVDQGTPATWQGKIVTTTKANVLAANAAVASDGSTWNGTTASGAPLDAVASVTGAWSLGRNMKTSFGAGTRYTKIGTAITALKDQSGSSRDFTDNGAVARRPVEATAFPANVLCADFAGDALMIMTTNLALSNFITAGSGAVVVSVIVDAVTSNTTPTYNNDAIIADQSQYMGLFARNLSGVTFYAYDWDGAEKAPSTTGSVGTAYVLMWRHNGGNQYISINGGAEVLVACGNTSALTGLLTLGGGAGGSTCNCKIAEVFTTSDGSQTAALAAAISSMGSYIGVSIPSAWTPFKLTTTLSSPQPGLAGYIHARVRAAKPSTTFYIDPTPILTPAGGGTTNAATAYTSSRYAYEGTETTEISITRVNGAADPTGQKQSRKIVTSANSQWLRPFKAEPYAVWNNVTGSNVTVTVCGTVNAGTLPNNDDIWMDVEYLTLNTGVPSPPAVDGSSVTGIKSGGGALATAALTTTQANDIIVVVSSVEGNGVTTPDVTSVTGGGLTFTRRSHALSTAPGGVGPIVEVWWAVAASPLAAIAFTVNYGATYDDAAAIAFGVKGCNTASPWDSNGSLPNFWQGSAATPTFTGVSTNSGNELLLMALGTNGNTTSFTEAAGFTQIGNVLNGGGTLFAWAHVSGNAIAAAQSSATITAGTSIGSYASGSVDSLVGLAAAPTLLGKLVTTTKANLLAANAAVASDGSSWSVPAFTSWNPSDLSQVTLSNNNLTAAATGAVNCGARGIAGFSTGKYYLEYTMTTWGVNIIVGLALSTPVFNTGIGVACVAKGGGVAISGTGQGSIGARANGDVIGIAVDISAGLIWFRAAPSGNWNGSGTANPATGVGGISISTMSGMLFPYFGSARVSDGDVLTANFGASSFIGAAPSGFAGWATTWSPFKLTTTLNAPSPGVAGYIHTRIRAAKPSTTYYIDPQIVLGVPPPTNNKAIDGTAGGQFSTTNTGTVTLTTTQPNDVIILSYFHNGGAGARTISTVTSAHLTWAKRSQHGWGGGPSDNEIWWATASSPLASEVITITLAGGNIDDAAYHAFGVSGCPNPSSPWDTNASLAAAFASVNTSVPLTLTVSGVTTDSSVPMLIGNTGTFNNALITVPSGTTAVRAEQINSGGILFARTSTFYQNYSSAISSASFTSTQPAGGGFSWGMTIDALA